MVSENREVILYFYTFHITYYYGSISKILIKKGLIFDRNYMGRLEIDIIFPARQTLIEHDDYFWKRADTVDLFDTTKGSRTRPKLVI